MVSNDVNAVRVILSLLNSEKWKEDMPRLVQGALARQKRGAWDLTLANAWGVLAMEKFSKAFEAVPVSGINPCYFSGTISHHRLERLSQGKDFFIPWPTKKEELSVSHQGEGKPWATIQSLAAIPLKEPFSSGYKIKKTIIPIEQRRSETMEPRGYPSRPVGIGGSGRPDLGGGE